MSDAKVSDCPQCNAKRASLTCDQCGLTMGNNWIGEVGRLRDINKELLEALCDCMKDSFTAADGMSQSGKRSFAGERYRKAVTAIAKAEGR